jgi:hypothetical protein
VADTGEWRAEARTALLVALAVTSAALPTAAVWWLLAPVPRLTRIGDEALLAESQGEYAVAADGWFALCTATAGLVCAVAVFAMIRHARVGALAGLTLGGLLAAVLTWRLGIWLGPSPAKDMFVDVADGASFDGPLALAAKGVLLAWPLASVIAYFALAAGLEPPARRASPDPGLQRSGRRFPVTVLRAGYSIEEVDGFFSRVDTGDVNGEDAALVRFRPTRLRGGYEGASVDAALASLVSGHQRHDGSARP